jgi:flagellin-specific chaperone FliS
LPNISNEVKKLTDNGLDLFVQNESPHQIINLLFEKQVNKVMFGEIFYSNDFEDWLLCVNQGEERRNEQHKEAEGKDVLNIFRY